MTRSYSPSRATSRRASSAWCWPSPSMIRMYSPVARRMPLFTAAPLPLLYGWRTTVAPAAAARARWSRRCDPSSTTMISCHGPAAPQRGDDLGDGVRFVVGGNDDGDRRTARPLSAPTRSRVRLARRRSAARRLRRALAPARQLERADAVEEILEQLAVRRDHVGEQADQQHLEADDHQHRRQDQRLRCDRAAVAV